MLDCLERHYAVLNQCNYVVLDEADRMIDLGFEPQVMGVMDAMPSSNLKPEMEEGVLEADRVRRATGRPSSTVACLVLIPSPPPLPLLHRALCICCL